MSSTTTVIMIMIMISSIVMEPSSEKGAQGGNESLGYAATAIVLKVPHAE